MVPANLLNPIWDNLEESASGLFSIRDKIKHSGQSEHHQQWQCGSLVTPFQLRDCQKNETNCANWLMNTFLKPKCTIGLLDFSA